MAGPLPHPVEQEFALLSNSTRLGPSTPPSCPFSRCSQDCALGLPARGGLSSPYPAVLVGPSHQTHVPGFFLEQIRGWGSSGPHLLPSTFLGTDWGRLPSTFPSLYPDWWKSVRTTFHPAEHQAGSSPVAFSAPGLAYSPPAHPQQISARISALSQAAPVGQ